MSGPSREVLAAFELERMMHRAAAERFERVRWGFACANPGLPQVWDASRVQVEPDMPVPSLDELLELTELPATWAPSLRHRQAYVCDGGEQRELALSLAKRGWHVTELWLMVARLPPKARPGGDRIDGPALTRLKGRLGVEQGLAPENVGQFDAYDRLRGRAAARVAYAGYDGRSPMALADMYLRGDIAVIEDVATLRRARRGGFGTAAVCAATAGALRLSARAVYLFSAPDVAQGFYEPLGFERIGGAWDCQLPPEGETVPWAEQFPANV